ncbi:uncharacterized protein LOC119612996 [Lucilia sericata]|uniref:uncharacterized protein LOC119612996 n=1 Tax=Lucilia sericata TaxID=13632 RepID=UPI0018A869AA|nr:uncharacterized protein LOC119612996 [Lucilia sericata]
MKLATTMFALIIFAAHMGLLIYAYNYYKNISTIFHLRIDHGCYSLISLMVMSIAVCLFRILQDVETFPIKFMHAFLHMLASAIMYYSLLDLEDPNWHYLHGFPAFVVYYGYFAQMAFALFIFMALPSGELREALAAIHSVIGVWLYYCYIGIAITGLHYCSTKDQDRYKEETNPSGVESDACLKLLVYYKNLLIISAILINFLLLFPYFQWDLIDPL